MDHIINRAVRKLQDDILQKTYEIAIDKMVERGFDPTNVKKINGKITFEVGKDELSGYEVEDIKADTTEEYVERYLDATIDQPRYLYDEDFEMGSDLANMGDMIRPGTRVDIEALEEWVRTVKINRDEDLQEALRYDQLKVPVELSGEWKSTLDRAVDHIVFKVARKIYYVGKKPKYMTPEEWDDYSRNLKPEQGSFSKNETDESWGERGFPYGPDYTYRQGNLDMPEESLSKQAFFKGWVAGDK